ncbi:MAG: PHP domain-containing protein [Nitrospiraceae bacterium]|nr:PHP domain-containing protein [Nitrospiraceae bacterium]
MNFRIDLHVHSKYSGDTDAEPEELISHAIAAGMNGIAFTEHYSFRASAPVERLREKYEDSILIVRGVELSAAEGHCLVFGADTDRLPLSHAPLEVIVRVVNEAGGVVIPSHPFRRGSGIGEALNGIEGICALEGYNGANLHAFNARAIEVAQELKLPFTGGSDAHAPREVGSCYTEFFEVVSSDNLITLLRKGGYRGADARKISRGWWPF